VSLWRDAIGRVRAPIVVVVFALVAIGCELGLTIVLGLLDLLTFDDLDSPRVIFSTAPTLVSGLIATLVCWLLFREQTGLRERRPHVRFSEGFVIGGLALTVCCVAPAVAGATSLTLTSRSAGVVAGLGLLELLLRGLGFQALRRGTGDIPAVVISSVVFGGLHLFNPGASWLAALAVALVGLWFGAITIRTGSVWMSMGLHVAWNFFEGFVFGQPVSGNAPGTALLLGEAPATAGFWSGGTFGPEAAGWTGVVLCVAVGCTLALPRARAEVQPIP
jgi:hypothetical protein